MKSKFFSSQIIWTSIGLGIFFWVIDSAVDAYIFGEGDFMSQIIAPALKELWVRLFAATVIISSGIFTQAMFFKQKKTENALKESEEKFRTVAETAPVAFIMIDNAGEISFWNKTAEKIFGYSEKEAIGKKIHLTIIPERFREAHLKALDRFGETGEGPFIGNTVEVSALRRDGTEFPLELSLSGVKVKDKWHATGIARDITERKRVESDLHRLNSELKTLYEVSQSISQTLDMNKFLPDVLNTLVKKEIFDFDVKVALFLSEEGKMRLAAMAGLPDTIISPCAEISPGECICGTALATGEVFITKDSTENGWHALCHPEITPHGRIVVPIRTADNILGLLSFYIPFDAKITEGQKKLLSSIGTQIGIAVNNARLYEETKTFSLHDALTGLANRRFLKIQFDKSLEAAKRYDENLSVIMLDIDHFKDYNDKYGHMEGDKLLVKLAEILLREVRRADYVFRYGGEEFLVLMPETDRLRAHEAAERLRTAVESESGVTISLGVATSSKEKRGEPDSLVRASDSALYLAKKNGRNRVEIAGNET